MQPCDLPGPAQPSPAQPGPTAQLRRISFRNGSVRHKNFKDVFLRWLARGLSPRGKKPFCGEPSRGAATGRMAPSGDLASVFDLPFFVVAGRGGAFRNQNSKGRSAETSCSFQLPRGLRSSFFCLPSSQSGGRARLVYIRRARAFVPLLEFITPICILSL